MLNYSYPTVIADLHHLFWLPIPMFLILIYWALFHNYPSYFLSQIKRGKSWIYMPMWWENSRKKIAKPITFLIYLVLGLSCGLSFNYFLDMYFIGLILGFVLGESLALLITKRCYNYRFKKEKEVYFRFYDIVVRQHEAEGKQFNEVEMKNRATYDYQSSLRKIDNEGTLKHKKEF